MQFVDEGIRILLRKSKTDQEKRGKILDIDYGRHEFTCPVRTLRNWLRATQIVSGRLFYHMATSRALLYVLKRYIQQAELTF